MRAQREILLARTAPEKDLFPHSVLFSDLSDALWFHGPFERRKQ